MPTDCETSYKLKLKVTGAREHFGCGAQNFERNYLSVFEYYIGEVG